MSPWIIERLDRRHDRAEFDCGLPPLTQWLHRSAGQFDRRDLARTFVLCERGALRVFGYYALSSRRVAYEQLPQTAARGLPSIEIPAVLLGKLAVDQRRQGQGLGELILFNALRRCQDVSEQIGVCGVEVDAINDAARRFYLGFDFIELDDDPRHLFLPMATIRKLGIPPLQS